MPFLFARCGIGHAGEDPGKHELRVDVPHPVAVCPVDALRHELIESVRDAEVLRIQEFDGRRPVPTSRLSASTGSPRNNRSTTSVFVLALHRSGSSWPGSRSVTIVITLVSSDP